MKIIGTGLSGLVGSRIAELLYKHEFVDFSLDSGVDITNKSLLQKAFLANKEAEIVIHLAAFTDVNLAWKQRGDKKGLCYQVNVIGTKNIAELCAQHNKYLIHISTDFVFDGTKKTLYNEDDKPNPIEWYGKTKYWAEKEVEKSAADYCIARIAFPFRANFPPKLDLVRKIIKGFKEDSLPPVFSDQIITPTFIDGIVDAVNSLINRTALGVYHVVGSTAVSPYELAVRISEVFGFDKNKIQKGSLEEYLKQGNRPRQKNLALSNTKIKSLGVKMRTLDEALKEFKNQLR
jgi:dTDP-4-dehydrorhamnose reductase